MWVGPQARRLHLRRIVGIGSIPLSYARLPAATDEPGLLVLAHTGATVPLPSPTLKPRRQAAGATTGNIFFIRCHRYRPLATAPLNRRRDRWPGHRPRRHYEWQLVGKKELYIPYNSYRLESTVLSSVCAMRSHGAPSTASAPKPSTSPRRRALNPRQRRPSSRRFPGATSNH
ncbi:DUF1329 domain-containing protein [Pseudomonas nicosulfuronedens]